MDEGELFYLSGNIMLMYYVIVVLCVYVLFICDVDYIVKDGEVIIVDEYIGCIMQGCCWFDGLYQVVEVKEGVEIQNENQMLVFIIFQNYFCLYEKLVGMIGMVDIEVFEFSFIYKLDIVVVLINCLMICKDLLDLVYMIEVEKIQVIIEDIKECIVNGQLVLVGMIFIEKFEVVFRELIKVGIKYNVLNVKFYVNEVGIVVQVGYLVVVIIVINMVGCGIDIMLGGSWQVEVVVLEVLMEEQIVQIKVDWQVCYDVVLVVGGLYIIGIECYEFCCIDNQLCGCFGCQGDLGFFCFYLLMEDVLMCIFVFDCVFGMMCKLGMKLGEVIEYLWVMKVIVNVQCKVESCNFDICK